MRDIRSVFSNERIRRALIGMSTLVVCLAGCSQPSEMIAPRTLEIQQQWDLQPGSLVGGRRISGGLGDISVDLGGGNIHAPFDGKVQPHEHQCLIYSTPEVPAYVFRFCDLDKVALGDVREGDVIGKGNIMQFAALRKQPSGQWAMVEPSTSMLERILARP
ncbi:MAG: hypothetical protein AAFR31_10805 [Cyanobacteria bacterium J06627_8]